MCQSALALLAVAALGLGACTAESDPDATAAVPAVPAPNVETVALTFDVTGMDCQGCVSTVESTIAGLDGVSSCSVSLDEGTATVAVTDPAAAPRIVSAVSEAGYEIAKRD